MPHIISKRHTNKNRHPDRHNNSRHTFPFKFAEYLKIPTAMNKGDIIPDLLGYDTEGKTVERNRFKGKALIIYFYPKDNTPGCTAEACSLRDHETALRALGYEIIGISRDSAASHLHFSQKHSLPFLLLSDPDAEVNRTFGVWKKKKMAGREYMGTVRTTFITDTAHHVTHIINKVDTKHAGTQLLGLLTKEEQR